MRPHKLWCKARALQALVSLAAKLSASELIHYFSSHPAAFGFQSSTQLDNITLSSANRKADQSLSDFQTGVGAAAYATLDTEQPTLTSELPWLILFPLYPILREVFYLSEVCNLLLKVHDILDNAVSK